MPTIVCPQCNKDDAIQKVSAVVAEGVSSAGSSTNLAKTLNIPPEPQKPLLFSYLGIAFIAVGFITIIVNINGPTYSPPIYGIFCGGTFIFVGVIMILRLSRF